jgi:hypothetical protein
VRVCDMIDGTDVAGWDAAQRDLVDTAVCCIVNLCTLNPPNRCAAPIPVCSHVQSGCSRYWCWHQSWRVWSRELRAAERVRNERRVGANAATKRDWGVWWGVCLMQ